MRYCIKWPGRTSRTGGAFDAALEKVKDKPWIASAKTMRTWLGTVLQMGIPQAKQVAPQMFEHFFQPFYEPVPTLEKTQYPNVVADRRTRRRSAPELTIETLKRLRQQGKPFSSVVFPDTDHGLQEFAIRTASAFEPNMPRTISRHCSSGFQAQR